MNAVTTFADHQPSYSTALQSALSAETLRQRVPAVFAPGAHERMSAAYTFISTARVLCALGEAGFLPVDARQAARARSPLHARHLIRLRRRMEVVRLRDAIPELLLGNAHDGTSAYQLRAGLFRVVCTNGLVVSMGIFPVWRVMHRGDVVDDVVKAALRISNRFDMLAAAVERMERTKLEAPQQLEFAGQALALRFPDDRHPAIDPAEVLVPRRPQDVGNDLWSTLNVVQEHLLKGGLARRTVSGRLRRTRGVTAIREDIRLNTALWEMAIARAA